LLLLLLLLLLQALDVIAGLEHPRPHTMSTLEYQRFIHSLVRA